MCWELSELFCRSLEGKNVESDRDNGGPACEVSEEAKTLPGLLGEESVVLVIWGWRINYHLQDTRTTKVKPFPCWDPQGWAAGAEKLAVIKRTAVPCAGSRTWQCKSHPGSIGFEGMTGSWSS